jgi:hypothetical protein
MGLMNFFHCPLPLPYLSIKKPLEDESHPLTRIRRFDSGESSLENGNTEVIQN